MDLSKELEEQLMELHRRYQTRELRTDYLDDSVINNISVVGNMIHIFREQAIGQKNNWIDQAIQAMKQSTHWDIESANILVWEKDLESFSETTTQLVSECMRVLDCKQKQMTKMFEKYRRPQRQ